MNVRNILIAICVSSLSLSCKGKSDAEPVKEEPGGKTELQYDLVVAQDGSGDYKTVQEAVNAVPGGKIKDFVILIQNGVYKEVVRVPADKSFVYFKGEDAEKTIITYDNYAKRLNSEGKEYGTSGSASVFINGNNFKAENITFENTAGIDAGQALAINIGAKRSAFKNCRFLGHQDTFYAGNGTQQYLVDCHISGTVDFIFGGSTAFFENCTLESLRSGYITAASTPVEQKFGYVFFQCKLIGKSGLQKASVYLGRPWRPYASVTYINCEMGEHIRPEGWHNWGNAENEKTARYAEYNSSGPGYQQGKRAAWSSQLTAAQAEAFNKEQLLGNWNPFNQ